MEPVPVIRGLSNQPQATVQVEMSTAGREQARKRSEHRDPCVLLPANHTTTNKTHRTPASRIKSGTGYGGTLGKALVLEGLAGHFVRQLYDNPPEPWEALPTEILAPFMDDVRLKWDASDYDHAAWFYGTGPFPRWLGYSLGYHIIGTYLEQSPGETPASLVGVDAGVFGA